MVKLTGNMEALSELDKILMNEMPRDEEYYDDGEEELEHVEPAEVSNAGCGGATFFRRRRRRRRRRSCRRRCRCARGRPRRRDHHCF